MQSSITLFNCQHVVNMFPYSLSSPYVCVCTQEPMFFLENHLRVNCRSSVTTSLNTWLVTPKIRRVTLPKHKAILTLIKFNMDTILYVIYILYSNFPSSPSKYWPFSCILFPSLPPSPHLSYLSFLIQDLIQDDTLHLVISLRRLWLRGQIPEFCFLVFSCDSDLLEQCRCCFAECSPVCIQVKVLGQMLCPFLVHRIRGSAGPLLVI